MTEPITRDELLTLIRENWARWDHLIASIPRNRMEDPVWDGWSVKDMIAHVAWGEREMVKLLRLRSMAGASELWHLPTDARNQAMVEASRARSLDEVLAEHRAAHAEMMALLADLPADALHDPAAFAGMPPDWSLFILLRGNTYLHYPEHGEMIRHWLAGS